MAFDFKTFGDTDETVVKSKTTGFNFDSFGVDKPISKSLTADQKSAQLYNATFPATTGESPVSAGLKALGNIPSSAFGLVKAIGSAAMHPIQTVKGISGAVVGGVEKLIPGEQEQEQKFNALAQFFKDRYGSLENLQRTATNDPFGFGTDVLGVISAGAGALGKTEQLSKGISTFGQTAIKPIETAFGVIKKGVKGTTKYGVSQATGLTTETIANIIDNPKAFSASEIKSATRQNLGGVVKESIDNRLDDLSDLGKGYESIKLQPGKVTIPSGTVESVLNKYGIKVVDGKIKTTAEAKPFTSADKVALEDFINVYGNEESLSNNAFLNTRSALSQMSKFDTAKTGNLTPIARELRNVYDDFGKAQIKGLRELDATYAPEVKILNQIKKDYMTPAGEFKDGAINKIANLTGAGKNQILGRLEQVVPGVTQRIKIVKAAEDIEKAFGLKVGTYARAGLAAFGIGTANVPAIVAAIISSPEVAVKLLQAYGYTAKTIKPVLDVLYKVANDINNFRLPGMMQNYIDEYIKNPKMGMSVEDITRSQPELIPKTGKTGKIQKQVSYPKTTTDTKLMQEAKKYKTAEEFVKFMRGSATQYGEYNPKLRATTGLFEDSARLGDLGIDPNKEIIIYRGIDGNIKNPKINDGDFVTTDYESAKSYTGGKVISMKVKANDLIADSAKEFDKTDPFYTGAEFVYSNSKNKLTNYTKSQLTDIWKKANKK